MKKIFAPLSASNSPFQVLTVEMASAQADLSSAEAYKERGISKLAAGDEQGAIADFDRSIELNPKDAQAYSAWAFAKYNLNDKQGAMNNFSIATELYLQQGNITKYQEGLKVIELLKAEGS